MLQENSPNPEASNQAAFSAHVYSRAWRIVIVVLYSISIATLFAILFRLSSSDAGPLNPLVLLRTAAAGCFIPATFAFVLRGLCSASVEIENGSLVIRQRHQTVEVPVDEVESVEPWVLPLPAPGIDLGLSSGKRWREGIEITDSTRFIDALSNADGSKLGVCRENSAMAFAEAKHAFQRRSLSRWILKFPAFALVPALPLFRVHQVIAYGGAFGEYYQYGLKAYVTGFVIYWATLFVYLLIYGAVLRVVVESLSFAAVHCAPAYASGVRRWSELVGNAAFFVGVPALVVLRFVPW